MKTEKKTPSTSRSGRKDTTHPQLQDRLHFKLLLSAVDHETNLSCQDKPIEKLTLFSSSRHHPRGYWDKLRSGSGQGWGLGEWPGSTSLHCTARLFVFAHPREECFTMTKCLHWAEKPRTWGGGWEPACVCVTHTCVVRTQTCLLGPGKCCKVKAFPRYLKHDPFMQAA